MKQFMIALAIASTAALPAFAATDTKTLSVPSAQDSGAGIPGQPGSKNGPTAKPGEGSATAMENNKTKEQDPSKIQGLPGNKSGPAAKPPK